MGEQGKKQHYASQSKVVVSRSVRETGRLEENKVKTTSEKGKGRKMALTVGDRHYVHTDAGWQAPSPSGRVTSFPWTSTPWRHSLKPQSLPLPLSGGPWFLLSLNYLYPETHQSAFCLGSFLGTSCPYRWSFPFAW